MGSGPATGVRLRQLHERRWSSAWQWLGFVALFFGLQGFLLLPHVRGRPWLMAPIWLLLGHVMHGHVIAFHESAHRTLIPKWRLNEAAGLLVGCLSFMSLTLYRMAHRTHHEYLATGRDEELWPFVVRGMPQWKRRLAACLELGGGLFYTPCLFLRAYLRRGGPVRSRRVRRQIALELSAVVAVWAIDTVRHLRDPRIGAQWFSSTARPR